MVRKKLDERIRTLFRETLKSDQRSLLVLVGDHGRDQVPNLHHILQRTSMETDVSSSSSHVPLRRRQQGEDSVLRCYKKELGSGAEPVARTSANLATLEQVRVEIQLEVAAGKKRLQDTTETRGSSASRLRVEKGCERSTMRCSTGSFRYQLLHHPALNQHL